MSMIPKRYVYDKVALILVSALLFITIVTILNIILRVATGQVATDYVTEYRSTGGIGEFTNGNVMGILSFIVFVILTAVISTVLSLKTYVVKRELSLTVLSFGILLCLVAAIVSNALLALR